MFAKKKKFLGRAATGLLAFAGLVNADLKGQIIGSGVMNMSQDQPGPNGPYASPRQGIPPQQRVPYPQQVAPNQMGNFAPLQGVTPQQAAMPHMGAVPSPTSATPVPDIQVFQDRAVAPGLQGMGPHGVANSGSAPLATDSSQYLGVSNQTGVQQSVDGILASARAFEEQGDLDRAGQTYQQGLMRNPDNRMLLLSYARMLHRQGDLDRAIAVYQRSLAVHRHDPVAMNDYGLCLARKGDLQQAATLLNGAVAARPDSTRYRNNLATVLIESGRMEEAYMQLAQAYGAPGAYYNLGCLLHRRGRTAEATHHLQQALRMDPSMQAAVEMLAKIEGTTETVVADRRAAAESPDATQRPTLRLQSATDEESESREVFAQFEQPTTTASESATDLPAASLRRLAPTEEAEPSLVVDPELLAQVVADQVAESVEHRLGELTTNDNAKSEQTASIISQQVIDALAGKLASNDNSEHVAKEVSTLLAQQVADVVAVKVGEAQTNKELSPEVAEALAKQVSESVVQHVTDTLANVQRATDTLAENVANTKSQQDLSTELSASLSESLTESLAEAVASRVAERIAANVTAQVQAQHDAAQQANQLAATTLAEEVATKAANAVLERAAREAAEKLAREAAEKLARETAEKLAAEKVAAEKQAAAAAAQVDSDPQDPAAAPEPAPLEIHSGHGSGPFGYTRPYSYYRRPADGNSRERLFDR